MKEKYFKMKSAIFGLAVGIVNGMLGAGGGMIAVPVLKKLGLDQKKAHANAVAVILPVTVVSSIIYLINGKMTFADALPFVPTGVIGSLCSAFLMKKIPVFLLKGAFAGFMIWAGVRLLLK